MKDDEDQALPGCHGEQDHLVKTQQSPSAPRDCHDHHHHHHHHGKERSIEVGKTTGKANIHFAPHGDVEKDARRTNDLTDSQDNPITRDGGW